MAKKDLPKRLFKTQDRVSSYQTGRSSGKLMKQMSRDHSDVLQNIEFVFVSYFRRHHNIDDHAVRMAIRASLSGSVPEDPIVADLLAALKSVREMRADTPDPVWNDGLRVIDDSVGRHSQLRPGETGYLSFASQYIQ